VGRGRREGIEKKGNKDLKVVGRGACRGEGGGIDSKGNETTDTAGDDCDGGSDGPREGEAWGEAEYHFGFGG
jgi:hypothetical protein